MQSDIQNALAYFAMIVSCEHKVFVKSAPGLNVIKMFSLLTDAPENKLGCSFLARNFSLLKYL
jgi:hypothetical protein